MLFYEDVKQATVTLTTKKETKAQNKGSHNLCGI